MRIFKWLTAIVFLVILAFTLAGLFLPSETRVARSVEIAAPPAVIYVHVASPKRFLEWSPWNIKGAKVDYTFEGPETGKGAKMTWKSAHPRIRAGSQEIVEARDNEYVRTALDFGEMGSADAGFTFEPVESGTKITWDFRTAHGGNPIGRWVGWLLIGPAVGADYAEGLHRLKMLVETGKVPPLRADGVKQSGIPARPAPGN